LKQKSLTPEPELSIEDEQQTDPKEQEVVGDGDDGVKDDWDAESEEEETNAPVPASSGLKDSWDESTDDEKAMELNEPPPKGIYHDAVLGCG
jgi:hypothetical protein